MAVQAVKSRASATDALFKTAGTEAAAPAFQPGRLPNFFRHYVNLLIMGHVLLILFNELFTIFERSWSARHNWLREGEHAENLSAHKPGAF